MLQRPWHKEGLACLDLYKYFLATQLSHVHNWLIAVDTNAALVLEAACLGSYEALRNLRGLNAPLALTRAMKTVLKAWSTAKAL